MTTARDTHNQIEYAKETGLEEGLSKGREERNMEVAINHQPASVGDAM